MVEISAKGEAARWAMAAWTVCNRIIGIDKGALIESILLAEKHDDRSGDMVLE
jgi:molybdenum cofactor biosynthesis enzyme